MLFTLRFTAFLLLLFCAQITAIKWLGMHKMPSDAIQSPSDCPRSREYRKLFGLSASQSKMCRRAVELMRVVAEVSRDTLAVCQTVFAGHRWNCSSLTNVPSLLPDLTKGTKEQAFVYALAAASLTQHIAKECAAGTLPNCPCGFGDTSAQTTLATAPNSNPIAKEVVDAYKWKGCSDNVMHGKRVSREWTESTSTRKSSFYDVDVPPLSYNFTNSDENGKYATRRKKTPRQRLAIKRRNIMSADITGDEVQRYFMDEELLNKNFHVDAIIGPKNKMNQHNSDVGRHITEQSLYRKCKCHGVSNSCDVKTCWYTLLPLQIIANRLKDKYATAQMIRQNKHKEEEENVNVAIVDVRTLRNTESAKQSLVYLKASADYCEENQSLGSFGTRMRKCNLTSIGPDSCESLCCGRGFNTQQMRVEEQCHCKYVHCCYVKCKTCIYDMDEYFCK